MAYRFLAAVGGDVEALREPDDDGDAGCNAAYLVVADRGAEAMCLLVGAVGLSLLAINGLHLTADGASGAPAQP